MPHAPSAGASCRRRPALAAGDSETYNRDMDDIRSMLDDGLARHRAGDLAAAENLYRQVLERDPGNGEAHHLSGVLRFQTGRPEEAVDSFRRALASGADDPRILANLGAAELVLGRLDSAIATLEQAASAAPETPQLLVNLGTAYRQAGRYDDAKAACEQAVERFPDDPAAHCNLAVALLSRGRYQEALAAAESSVSLAPDDAECLNTLGSAFLACERRDCAIETFRKAVAIAPQMAEAARNLALALQESRRYEQAAAQYESVIGRWPDDAAAHAGLARTRRLQGRLGDAIESGRTAVALNPSSPTYLSNLLFCLIGSPDQDGMSLKAEHALWNSRFASSPPFRRHENSRDPERILRVGLVSPDFRDHPVGRIVEPVLRALNPDRIHIVCYSDAVGRDEIGRRLADRYEFSDLVGMRDAAAADRILSDGIDILVDLAGHSARNRLGVFALRPAPVQASWLGYMSTTGVSAIDYTIGDAVHAPEEFDGHFTEQVWRLPRDLACLPPPDDAPPVVEARRVGEAVVFGSFNNPGKVTDRAIELWARILGNAPGSVLLMRYAGCEDATVQSGFRARFGERGIDPDRLRFEGSSSYRDALDAYNRVDVALDTFPYSGTMTTMEALWMGVPVVALAGDRMVARQAAAHLTAAGLGELVGGDAEEYVRFATGLAEDFARRAALRKELRERLARSELMDAEGLARALEDAWRGMWRRWCLAG